jgi:hypothetical protein
VFALLWIPIQCWTTRLMYQSPPMTLNETEFPLSTMYMWRFCPVVNLSYLRNLPISTGS